jgi:hypothetical protein
VGLRPGWLVTFARAESRSVGLAAWRRQWQSPREAAARFRTAVAARRMLILLDNAGSFIVPAATPANPVVPLPAGHAPYCVGAHVSGAG